MNDDERQVKRLLADLRYPEIAEHHAKRIDAVIATEAALRTASWSSRYETATSRAVELTQEATKARAESAVIHVDLRRVLDMVADTERAVALTMESLASQHPSHADLLGELSQAATLGAAQAAKHAAA